MVSSMLQAVHGFGRARRAVCCPPLHQRYDPAPLAEPQQHSLHGSLTTGFQGHHKDSLHLYLPMLLQSPRERSDDTLGGKSGTLTDAMNDKCPI
ncbi:hypothetical protein EYF80_023082 [Liparis tanakae]|uniref:Uncharacterized protein n=1 Tax=Liparis tanakae TaxID=230148 RepID=A0A4Z2HNX6_9TELE|nr:hypothetical protein EYF80_023082 [Liparis tanakae]